MPRRHPIKKNESTQKIKKYIDILKEAADNAADLPPLVKKYFASSAHSFVFYKSQLDAAFILSENANALKVYLAAEEQVPAQGESTINPTLIVVPCSVNSAETTAQNRFPNRTDDGGDQYPITFYADTTASFDIEDD